MHFTTLLTSLLAVTVTTTTAAPAPFNPPSSNTTTITVANTGDTTPNLSTPTHTGLVKRANNCGASSFENRGSGASPFISDCMRMHDNLAGSGEWTYSSFEFHRTIARYGSCNFGIESGFVWSGITFIGTEDVRDLIRDSVSMFGRGDGRVGSRGKMKCGQNDIWIEWGLF
ncbi:putative necrosis-inducing factor-domain-containing protein [Cercophora samala]|uniref:Necrosis-inducing factor-domain-containing protein n=1 Tax=Cercophora samala TaxID=330535 RepID=A0AA40D762_9PEZI|nr:putative necrosis-inducing factor-domain-containing protein [Cercophora samala]